MAPCFVQLINYWCAFMLRNHPLMLENKPGISLTRSLRISEPDNQWLFTTLCKNIQDYKHKALIRRTDKRRIKILTLIVYIPLSALIAASAISLWEYLTKPHPSDKNKEKYYLFGTAVKYQTHIQGPRIKIKWPQTL